MPELNVQEKATDWVFKLVEFLHHGNSQIRQIGKRLRLCILEQT